MSRELSGALQTPWSWPALEAQAVEFDTLVARQKALGEYYTRLTTESEFTLHLALEGDSLTQGTELVKLYFNESQGADYSVAMEAVRQSVTKVLARAITKHSIVLGKLSRWVLEDKAAPFSLQQANTVEERVVPVVAVALDAVRNVLVNPLKLANEEKHYLNSELTEWVRQIPPVVKVVYTHSSSAHLAVELYRLVNHVKQDYIGFESAVQGLIGAQNDPAAKLQKDSAPEMVKVVITELDQMQVYMEGLASGVRGSMDRAKDLIAGLEEALTAEDKLTSAYLSPDDGLKMLRYLLTDPTSLTFAASKDAIAQTLQRTSYQLDENNDFFGQHLSDDVTNPEVLERVRNLVITTLEASKEYSVIFGQICRVLARYQQAALTGARELAKAFDIAKRVYAENGEQCELAAKSAKELKAFYKNPY
jgi:hypothetical protein